MPKRNRGKDIELTILRELTNRFVDSFLNSNNRKRRVYVGPFDPYSSSPESYFPHLNILIDMARATKRLEEDNNNPGTYTILPRPKPN